MFKDSKINEDNKQLMGYMQDLEHYPIQTKFTWMAFSNTSSLETLEEFVEISPVEITSWICEWLEYEKSM